MQAETKIKATRDGSNETGAPSVPTAAAREFARALALAEKCYGLYPPEGKVVEGAIKTLVEALRVFQEAAGGPLELEVGFNDLFYEGESVYREEGRSRNIASRLQKDSVKKIIFREGTPVEEIQALLASFKEAGRADETEDDFTTVFWEKDCTRIQIEVVEHSSAQAVDVGSVGSPRLFRKKRGGGAFNPKRLGVDEAEQQRLREVAASRKEHSRAAEGSFLLTESDHAAMKAMIERESSRSPLNEFVGLLIEHMAHSSTSGAIDAAMEQVRLLVQGLVEGLEFDAARALLDHLAAAKPEGFGEHYGRAVKDLLKGLSGNATMRVIIEYLRESPEQLENHAVFDFLRSLGSDIAPHASELLSLRQHVAAISEVLAGLGAPVAEIIAQQVLYPDAEVAQAALRLLSRTSKDSHIEAARAALKHPDPTVQFEAASGLASSRDPRVAGCLAPLLEDPSDRLLAVALGFFARSPCAAVAEALMTLIRSKRFEGFDDARQDACFKALALANPSRSAVFITGEVLKWTFCLGQRSRRRKAAALRALKNHPGSKSVAVLDRFARRARAPLAIVAKKQMLSFHKEARRAPAVAKDKVLAAVNAAEQALKVLREEKPGRAEETTHARI
jgi:hypothetical protein